VPVQGGLVAEAHLAGDGGDGPGGAGQGVGGGLDPDLHDVLARAELEQLLHAPLELAQGQPGHGRQLLQAQPFAEVPVDVRHGRGERRVDEAGPAGLGQIGAEAGQGHHLPGPVLEGQLLGEAPAGTAVRVEGEVQGVHQRLAGAEQPGVLLGVALGHLRGPQLEGGPAQGRIAGGQPAALHPAPAHGQVAPVRILHREHGVPHPVEQLLHEIQAAQAGQQDLETGGAGERHA